MNKLKNVVLLDLFSGIGGFSLGLTEAGFNITDHYYSEIDKNAIAVYQHKFKESKYVGSVTDISELPKRPNIITFGSPCQDFSLAGKRRGMEGKRSSLISSAIALVNQFKPDVFIWENVKGAYSSNNGADFWAIISAFANLDGYRLEQQLLNTAWILPQNRERIYLVGHLTTSERSYEEVFPFGENDSMPNEGISRRLEVSAQRANCLNARMHKMGRGDTYIAENLQGKVRIRRLTEIECARLQGFPDDWNKYGVFDGEVKEISSTQRYKQYGNAVTATIVKKIGERLLNNAK